ncbi:MAG TPA: hypothetical protein PK639_04150 [Candidatus Woesebacteria bacterium]|nr:hypothetical protein [Candidatus Woesebacteria bacterium]
MIIKFKVSEEKIVRREEAFLALSISSFLGSILAAILFGFSISYLFLVVFGGFLFLVNIWLKVFFNRYLKMKTCLSKEYLIRGKGKFLIKEINKLTIKRTTNNTVREIGIFFDNGKSLFINGLSNFESFEKQLIKNIDKNVVIKNIREPLDFDSIFFYPILGLILSLGTGYLFKLMANFSYQTMQIVLYVSIIYIFLLGIYLVISKPIAKRY